jgi:threonylcarbamoyladenosine tRNA methylthiotransferase MtaB
MLRILGQKKKHAFYKKMIGQIPHVLTEGDVERTTRFGFTDNYVRVGVPVSEIGENAIVPVEITGFENERCLGHVNGRQVAA